VRPEGAVEAVRASKRQASPKGSGAAPAGLSGRLQEQRHHAELLQTIACRSNQPRPGDLLALLRQPPADVHLVARDAGQNIGLILARTEPVGSSDARTADHGQSP